MSFALKNAVAEPSTRSFTVSFAQGLTGRSGGSSRVAGMMMAATIASLSITGTSMIIMAVLKIPASLNLMIGKKAGMTANLRINAAEMIVRPEMIGMSETATMIKPDATDIGVDHDQGRSHVPQFHSHCFRKEWI